MQTKGANRTSKDVAQAICDAIFKVVDHKLKELDSKWTKQIKGKSEQGEATASVVAGGKNGVLFIIPVSLDVSDWERTSDGTYVTEVSSTRVADNMTLTGYTLSTDATGCFTGALTWETAPGKITLITSTPPDGVIKGSLILRK